MSFIKFIKSNIFTFLLLGCVIVGGVCGACIGPNVAVVKPVGDIFMNLVITLVVPLVFFSISSSISRLCAGGDAGKVLGWTLVVFIMMSVAFGLLSYFAALLFNPVGGAINEFMSAASAASTEGNNLSVPLAKGDGSSLVKSVTVGDFPALFSRMNILPMMVAAILTGFGSHLAGEKGRAFRDLLDSGSEVMMRIMGIIMYAAPLGLGCYFAVMIADLGSQVIGGYVRICVLCCSLVVIIYFGINTLIVAIAKGRHFVPVYWKCIIPPSITAMASASSTVAMPGNIEALKKMGVSEDIADSVMPFGTNIHKEGSIILGVLKNVFLVMIAGGCINSPSMACIFILVSIVCSVVVSAIPVGGLTSEIIACILLGLDPSMAGVIVLASIMMDIPCTLLNASCNVSAAVVIDALCSRKK